jgi:hypothetical protein
MTTTPKPPRECNETDMAIDAKILPVELWISGINFDEYIIPYNTTVTGFLTADNPKRPESRQFIEKSAYDAVVAERDREFNLRIATEFERDAAIAEQDELRTQNAALVERLRSALLMEYTLRLKIGDTVPSRETYVAAELAKLGVQK